MTQTTTLSSMSRCCWTPSRCGWLRSCARSKKDHDVPMCGWLRSCACSKKEETFSIVDRKNTLVGLIKILALHPVFASRSPRFLAKVLYRGTDNTQAEQPYGRKAQSNANGDVSATPAPTMQEVLEDLAYDVPQKKPETETMENEADDLSESETEMKKLLEAFPNIFGNVATEEGEEEAKFGLHLRLTKELLPVYYRKLKEGYIVNKEKEYLENLGFTNMNIEVAVVQAPLKTDEIEMLISYVERRAADEKERKEAMRTMWITIGTSSVSAIIAALTFIFTVLLPWLE